jgi:acyl-coenzyme A synthetase/AMP-(fatty) acid ligase
LRAIFVAGAPVSDDMRRQAGADLNLPVVDIYGMAQFDMVAASLPGDPGLALVPYFEYSLAMDNGECVQLRTGLVGDLRIRRSRDTWHRSGDIVEVLGEALWPAKTKQATHRIRVLGRANVAITLADGSSLTELQVRDLLKRKYPQVQELQVQLQHTQAGDALDILCVPRDGSAVDLEALRADVMAANVDINDSFRAGVAIHCGARIVKFDDLVVTARGKIPLVCIAE